MSRREISIYQYALRRLLEAVPLVFVIITINFLIINLAPGDPIHMFVGEATVDPEYVARVRAEYGLDKPIFERYYLYIFNVMRGNLGFSWIYRRPVTDIIFERLPLTVLLMGTQLVLATILGVLLGIFASRNPYSAFDSIVTTTSLLAYSLPHFWLGMMFILLFAVTFNIFPAGGIVDVRAGYTGLSYYADVARHLVLPSLTLGLSNLATVYRLTRSSMLEQIGMDYVLTAKAKGCTENTVLLRHAARNALLPVVTIVGFFFAHIVSGTVVVEAVFSWLGIGKLLYDSLFSRDYPVAMGIFIMVSIAIIIANLFTDIIYSLLDPRIRYR